MSTARTPVADGTRASRPAATPSLAAWRQAFEGAGPDDPTALDHCPWPGPRPLSAHDSIVGRQQDIARFRQEVEGHKLIVLSGPSGVGKSSLLQAGLIPDLEAAGYEVAVCKDYGGDVPDGPSGPADFIAGKVHDQFVTLRGVPATHEMFWHLNAQHAKYGILVLDQFEELIRYAPALKESIFEFLLQLNEHFESKVIISLRDEFLHELRPVENQVRPFSFSQYILSDIDAQHAEAVVLAGNDTGGATVADDEVAKRIATYWRAAREHTKQVNIIDPFGRVGLLHLQAFLYTLHAAATGSLPISAALVDQVAARLRDGEAPQTATIESGTDGAGMAAAFQGALLGAVTVKLERCRDAARVAGFDDFLIVGTTELVARAAIHLSSAGYKLVREAADLLAVTLDQDLESLIEGSRRQDPQSARTAELYADPGWDEHPPEAAVSSEAVDHLFRELLELSDPSPEEPLDLVSASREQLAERADATAEGPEIGDWRTRLHPGARAWVADPMDVTCGPMLGMSAASVLIEELRRFVLVLMWMKESSLIRITTPGRGEAMLSLIHDGFGQALNRWAGQWRGGPEAALHALTAPRGASFAWEFDGADVVGTSRTRVIANLRWRGGWVRTRFADVALVNCDLRGTLFDSCTFERVTFINCLMDGTIFSDCRFVGGFEPVDSQWDEDEVGAPAFVLDVDGDYVQAIASYRGVDAPRQALWSPVPGFPAEPAEEGAHTTIEDFAFATGGVVIYGGRMSALVVRGCDFSDGGLSLRHTSGSGLELVELTGCQLDMYGSALRQLSFSSRVIGESADLRVHGKGSFIGQVWVGQGLDGTIDLTGCTVVQVWNESGVRFTVEDATVMGLVGVDVGDVLELPSHGLSVGELDRDGTLLPRTRQMDYRRNPAREYQALRRIAR